MYTGRPHKNMIHWNDLQQQHTSNLTQTHEQFANYVCGSMQLLLFHSYTFIYVVQVNYKLWMGCAVPWYKFQVSKVLHVHFRELLFAETFRPTYLRRKICQRLMESCLRYDHQPYTLFYAYIHFGTVVILCVLIINVFTKHNNRKNPFQMCFPVDSFP